ncbi:ATP-dependent DNA helicase [Actinoallomurus iriomotensis]|uniref:ATP-dependent helicase DinG n=1 Tax=Actinoallomurus iriomotensis TaxID=478107 RepID=A0A9W6RPK5_9ACTN|nr:ATP-dependent DNA helicase [Actinoallomurus iriomotensis]GLY77832.1 ATP-dependent DNA helicase DinG [Actinoallomurus iriomotensis]
MPDDLLDSASDETDLPDVSALLAAAVSGVGGAERPGQVKMAEAVAHAIDSGEHLAVQAGTGTGKSLAYLVPAVRHAVARNTCVVVSTATIALQRQLIDRDLPRLAESLKPLLGREPVFAILKGRRNYLCRHRLQVDAPEDPEEILFDPQTVSAAGRQVQRIHEWAETTDTGDRDELVPGVNEHAWRQVSVSARECLGAQRCPFGTECYAEQARDRAGDADIVVTNHALLAIDALEDYQVLPEHDVVIVDEAHELVDRVTSVATAELSAQAVEITARRCGRLIEEDLADRLKETGEALAPVLADLRPGRLDVLPQEAGVSLAAIRDAAHACATALRTTLQGAGDDAERLGAGRAALTSLEEIHDTAVRFLESFAGDLASRHDVVWLDKPFSDDSRRPVALRVAPLGVGALLRERLFRRRTTVLTSATLSLGGSFEPLARQWGLPAASNESDEPEKSGESRESRESGGEGAPITWSGLDVGSPFDHARSGILYIARGLPSPGRDGLPEAYLTELSELIEAAGGRTLGLFSSMRAAKQAAEELKGRIAQPLLCQGEDSTSQLVKRFAEDDATCLFGTLSLWQGVDVPGPSLRLVVIDRIPFPRPDDPLSSARQRAIAARGGNGFMAVAATNAALLLAQGAGRLLRSMDDRGVVAILDPRLATARYGSFLRASLPPFWTTYDSATVKAALRRLDAS